MKYATKRLIGAVWTVAYTVGDDGRATIHGYGRSCAHGYDNERQLDRCQLVERSGRTVERLMIQPHHTTRSWATVDGEGAVVFEVSNPQNVFSYGEAPEPKKEIS